MNPSGSTLKRDLFNFSKIFQLKDKISEDDKKKVLDKCQETLSWLDANQTTEKDEFEHHHNSKVWFFLFFILWDGRLSLGRLGSGEAVLLGGLTLFE